MYVDADQLYPFGPSTAWPFLDTLHRLCTVESEQHSDPTAMSSLITLQNHSTTRDNTIGLSVSVSIREAHQCASKPLDQSVKRLLLASGYDSLHQSTTSLLPNKLCDPHPSETTDHATTANNLHHWQIACTCTWGKGGDLWICRILSCLICLSLSSRLNLFVFVFFAKCWNTVPYHSQRVVAHFTHSTLGYFYYSEPTHWTLTSVYLQSLVVDRANMWEADTASVRELLNSYKSVIYKQLPEQLNSDLLFFAQRRWQELIYVGEIKTFPTHQHYVIVPSNTNTNLYT